jgi:hypothetical protein
MLEIEIPSIFSSLKDLIDEYLDDPEKSEKKELVDIIIADIDDILAGGNPILTIGDETATELEFYVSEQIKLWRSEILIVALKCQNLYTLFKSNFLQKFWDDFLVSYNPPNRSRTSQPISPTTQTLLEILAKNFLQTTSAPKFTPFPNQHSLDTLISNLLCNEFSRLKKVEDNTEAALIKRISFLAHAALYGGLTAIEKSAFYIGDYIDKKPYSEHDATLLNFLKKLLDEASKIYLHLGLRLRGVYFMRYAKMIAAKGESKDLVDEYFLNGITNLLIAKKLEQYVCIVESQRHIESAVTKAPAVKLGKFAAPRANVVDNSLLVEKLEITTYDALLLGYYHRGLQFETVEPEAYVANCDQYGFNEENLRRRIEDGGDIACKMETTVKEILASSSLRTDMLDLASRPKLIHSY